MILKAMQAVAADLNTMLQRQRGDSRDRVILGSLANTGARGADEVEDKICLTLTHITEERNVASMAAPRVSPEGTQRLAAPISLNLHVLFTAKYSRYEVGLEMISQVIAYLHAKPLFTQANTPAMAPGLDRLQLEMIPMSSEEQGHLWGMLGASYVPSALYSLRMLTFGGGQIDGMDPTIQKPIVNKQA